MKGHAKYVVFLLFFFNNLKDPWRQTHALQSSSHRSGHQIYVHADMILASPLLGFGLAEPKTGDYGVAEMSRGLW